MADPVPLVDYDRSLEGKPLRYLIGADVSQWPLVEVDVPVSDWRVAKSLEHWRAQVDAFAPDRDKSSDGTIGDQAHQATHSEHNPDENGVVRAMDISHDPFHGVDTWAIADHLLASHDPRIRYVISNRRIGGGEEYAKANGGAAWTWGHYGGANPHDHHVHMSVVADPARYDDVTDWAVHKTDVPSDVLPVPLEYPTLKLGSIGAQVAEVQRILGIAVDETFGKDTEDAVIAFQLAHGLKADGIVGRQTWDALRSGKAAPPAEVFPYSSKGSWYSQYDGKYHWHDGGDEPGSAALGVPDTAQGIALPSKATLGLWFMVRAPNSVTSIEQQTDRGPAVFTGRTMDVSAAAAERFGYSPDDLHLPNVFPTDAIFSWRPIDPPAEVAGLTPQQQATRYRDLRGSIVRKPDTPLVPVPVPVPAPHEPTVAELFTQIDAIAEVLRKLADTLDGIRKTLTEKTMATQLQPQPDWGAILQPIIKAILPELMKVLPQLLPQILPALLPLLANLLTGRSAAAVVQTTAPATKVPTGTFPGVIGMGISILSLLLQATGKVSADVAEPTALFGGAMAVTGGAQAAKATFIDKPKETK